MIPTNNGGPAFPWREEDGAGGYCQHEGMSLRDYFAGQALAGLLTMGSTSPYGQKLLSEQAYAMADAMLAERAKGGAK